MIARRTKILAEAPKDLRLYMEQTRGAIGGLADELFTAASPLCWASGHAAGQNIVGNSTRLPGVSIDHLRMVYMLDNSTEPDYALASDPSVLVGRAHVMLEGPHMRLGRQLGSPIEQTSVGLHPLRKRERWIGVMAVDAHDPGATQRHLQISTSGNVSGRQTDSDQWDRALKQRSDRSGVSPELKHQIAQNFLDGINEAAVVALALHELHGLESNYQALSPYADHWQAVVVQTSPSA